MIASFKMNLTNRIACGNFKGLKCCKIVGKNYQLLNKDCKLQVENDKEKT